MGLLLTKKYKNQYTQLPNTSKFHEEFRQLAITEPKLKHLQCYQEVAVQDLVPMYEYKNHHFDWFIKELDLIVELHGKQHYKLTNYGNISADDMLVNFRNLQFRDGLKALAAKTLNYGYVAIPYTYYGKLSYSLLMSLAERANE